MSPEERAAALTAIAQQISTCTRCGLHAGRRRTVPGAGNMHTEIMFIGEGPGENEDRQGLPFVGRSGDYLNYLLSLIGLKREMVFITNVVKCRPPNNRDPLPDEITACKTYLDDQIQLIDPLVICTLGRFSMARYFPNAKISAIHGQPRFDEEAKRAYYPMFHPAAALRAPELRRDMEADMRRLVPLLEQMKARRGGTSPDPAVPQNAHPPAPAQDHGDELPKQLPLF